MAKLEDAVPVETMAQKFKKFYVRDAVTSVDEFLKREPTKIPPLCMFIWDEMVHRGVIHHKDKFKISPIVNNDFKGIYDFVKNELHSDPVTSAFSAHYFNEISREESFADVALAECFPEDIHICDVEFSDNRERVRANKHRKYKGLHVFGEFLDRLRGVARDRGANRISLIAASPPAHEVFTRYGFKVGESEIAKQGYEQFGFGHSMYLNVN